LLCLTGDGVGGGDQPGAMPVFDLDSVSLLQAARVMRDQSRFMSGRQIVMPPDLFLGAAINPFAPPFDMRPLRLAKKIAAGAQFVQTQFCFDIEALETYMRQVVSMNLHRRCRILVGVGPVLSAKSARWMRNHVPGVRIPDAVVRRLEESRNEAVEGKRICIELIQHIRTIPGVAGVHVMAHKHERLLAEIINESIPGR
jgi:5,10-methylenetetrahydrofolate reductase